VEIRLCVFGRNANVPHGEQLKVESPRIQIGIFSSRPSSNLSAFVSAPDRNGLARSLIRELKEPQLLTDGESFWYHGQAGLGTDLHSLPFGTQAFSSLVSFDATATRELTRPLLRACPIRAS